MRLKKLCIALSIIGITSALTPAYAYYTSGGKVYDGVGNEIAIDGVAWIGFQDSNFLGGLWNVPFNPIGTQHGVIELLKSPWTVPGSNVTSSNSGASFKAIRLAIQPGIWHAVNTVQSSPFDFSKTDKTNPTTGNGPFCDWTKGADASGHCIQAKSAPDLLTATINEFNNQNVLVMLDFHHRPGLGDGFRDGTVVASDYTLQTYHDDVANFAKTAAANVLGIDIYNEPHQLFWYSDNTQTSPAQPAWIKVIAAAAAAVYDSNPNLLLFVEGPGGTNGNDPYDPVNSQNRFICLPSSTKVDDTSVISFTADTTKCNTANPERVTNIGVNWGENFRALLDPTQSVNGVASFDVNTFRAMLVQALNANKFSSTDANIIADWLLGKNNDGNNGHLVFAPHLYGKQVAGWQSDANDSPIRFKWNFGFLLDSGFPFVVGELGYDVQIPATGGEDFFLNSVAPYLINKKINHNLFFWTWNYSDYPVGVRANDSDLTLFAWKEKDLHDLFNAIVPLPTVGTLCVTVPTPTGYAGTAFPTISATGNGNAYQFPLTNFNQPLCVNNVATGGYNLTGSTIVSTDGTNYIPQQAYSASVATSTETDVSVQYVKAPTGTLQVNVTGVTQCPISNTQSFAVNYSNGTVSNQLTVTGTTAASISLPVGSYTIKVTPDPLPNNAQCKAQYNTTAAITNGVTTTETVNYIYSQAASCSVTAKCSTWGEPSDSWAGSSCNFYLDPKLPLSNPAVYTMQAIGISSIVQPAWGATATLTNGNVVMTLTDPVNNKNIGFNATGIITLPSQATVTTNGQVNTCSIVASFTSSKKQKHR